MMYNKLEKTRRGLQGDGGFLALTAIMVLAIGTLAFSLVAMSSAVSYADGVYAREMRIQRALDLKACQDTTMLIRAKDVFAPDITC